MTSVRGSAAVWAAATDGTLAPTSKSAAASVESL